MSRTARVKQADIARALKEAKKAGAVKLKINHNGDIEIVLTDDKLHITQHEGEEPKPVKRLDF